VNATREAFLAFNGSFAPINWPILILAQIPTPKESLKYENEKFLLI
jgi:hypothetical protein